MKIAAVILAGGQSRRMGDTNKLFAIWHDNTLIKTVSNAALGSKCSDVFVVGGFDLERLREELKGLSVIIVENSEYKSGMGSSVVTGIRHIGDDDYEGAVIMLGDMPMVGSNHIDTMIEAFRSSKGNKIIVASHEGKRGNPVLWPQKYFAKLLAITGDKGAREILELNRNNIRYVEIGQAAHMDIDTPGDLEA